MAVRYAVANGNWSATSTWDGGASIPTTGDDVYANSYTVNIDQDIEVAKISTEVCPTTSNDGGTFSISPTSSIMITANIVAGRSYCLFSSIYNLNLTIVGDIIGGYATNSYGFYTTSQLNLTLIGNLIGGSGTNAHAYYRYGGTAHYHLVVSMVGNIVCSTTGRGISQTVGYVYATITGNIYSDAYAISPGNEIEIIGNIYVNGLTNLAIYGASSSESSLLINGNIYCNNGIFAFTNFKYFKINSDDDFILKLQNEDNNDVYLYTSDAFDQPGEENVRNGISYASGTLEGTLAVPPPESVVKNVPVDDTVGTYELTPEVIEHITELQNPKKVLGSGIIAY